MRRLQMKAVADAGAVMVMLPQEVVERLGLRERGNVIVTYADERKEERPVAGIVTVRSGEHATELGREQRACRLEHRVVGSTHGVRQIAGGDQIARRFEVLSGTVEPAHTQRPPRTLLGGQRLRPSASTLR